jgi:lysophospholipase L1-like esterase
LDFANLNKYKKANLCLAPTTNLVVFMGDSITEFWSNYNKSFFENNYINRGISGQTTSQMVLRFRQDVIDLKPSKVVILAGINDIAQNTGPIAISEIMGNLISMVELAQANAIKIILCSVLPANHFTWNHKIQPADKVIEMNDLIQKYATAQQIDYVDYYSKMVDTDKGLQIAFGEDGVHSNAEGYKIMETILTPFLL